MTAIDQILVCAELLVSVGERSWSGKLQTFAESVEGPLDPAGAEEILSWYGGMGSFSDVYLSRLNDHNVSDDDEDVLNARLAQLRSSIYESATKAKRESR